MERRAEWRIPVPFEPPVFGASDADMPQMLAYLEKYGYAMVQALTEDEIASAEDIFWSEAAANLGWFQGEPRTWEANVRKLTMAGRSDCGHLRGWDLSEFAWFLRKAPGVRRIYNALACHFSAAADSDPQLAAFNGVNVFRPHGVLSSWRTTSEPWYHVDNPKPDPSLGLHQPKLVFPGVLNVMDVSADTGGFVCVPKSHLLFGTRPEVNSTTEDDYLDLAPFNNFLESEPNERVGNTMHTQPVLLTTGGRRGTLIIWDPRTVHCSTSSLTPDDENVRAKEPELLRLANFLSLCPASWATPGALVQRRELVEARTCANTSIPFAVMTQRRFEAVAFYEGFWQDEEAMQMVWGVEGGAQTAASHGN